MKLHDFHFCICMTTSASELTIALSVMYMAIANISMIDCLTALPGPRQCAIQYLNKLAL